MSQKYSDEQLIDILIGFYKRNNRIPKYADFKKRKPNVSTFHLRFGSWTNALKKAGLIKEKLRESDYTNDELIAYLKRFYQENNRVPTTRDFKCNKHYPHPETYRNRFGNWKVALEKAELYQYRNDKYLFQRKTYTDEILLDKLDVFIQQFYTKHKKLPTSQDIVDNKCLPALSVYHRRFGSLIYCYEILGYDCGTAKQHSETSNKGNQQLLDELQNIINKYGKISCHNFSEYGLSGFKTYLRRFNIDSYYELLVLAGFENTYAQDIRTISDKEVVAIYQTIKKDLGTMPTLKEIDAYTDNHNLPSITHKIYWRWGGYTSFLKDIGDHKDRKFQVCYSEDGRQCFSRFEQIISNVLYSNEVFYEKDMPYKTFIRNFHREYTVDYYLPQYNVYIEVFGMVGVDDYDNRVTEKQMLFESNNLNLISIFPIDFQNNNYKMESFIRDKLKNIPKSTAV